MKCIKFITTVTASLLLCGCLSTAVGVAAGTAVAVTGTVVKVPVKAGQTVAGVLRSDDKEKEKSRD